MTNQKSETLEFHFYQRPHQPHYALLPPSVFIQNFVKMFAVHKTQRLVFILTCLQATKHHFGLHQHISVDFLSSGIF